MDSGFEAYDTAGIGYRDVGRRSTKVFVHARENLLTENLREMLTIKIPVMIINSYCLLL